MNRFKPGNLVNTPNGPGLVIGDQKLPPMIKKNTMHSSHVHKILVSPTGQDPPYSSKVAYCETWSAEELIKRGWRAKPYTVSLKEFGKSQTPRARKVPLRG